MTSIKIWVNATPTTNFTEMFEAKLPQKETWFQIQKTLRTSVDIHVAGEGYKQGPGGRWKYQLVSRDLKRVIKKASVYLDSDGDYRTLVERVRKGGEGGVVAVLTQERGGAPTTARVGNSCEYAQTGQVQAGDGFGAGNAVGKEVVGEEGVWYEGPMSEPLDEEGKPYFDPYDREEADRVVVKWAEEHTGLMD